LITGEQFIDKADGIFIKQLYNINEKEINKIFGIFLGCFKMFIITISFFKSNG